METPKLSIIEKIAQNRKLIIKRTLQIGAGVVGTVLVGAFLAKERFEEVETTDIGETDHQSYED